MGCTPAFSGEGKSASVFSGEVVFLPERRAGRLCSGALGPPAGPGFQVRALRRLGRLGSGLLEPAALERFGAHRTGALHSWLLKKEGSGEDKAPVSEPRACKGAARAETRPLRALGMRFVSRRLGVGGGGASSGNEAVVSLVNVRA